MKVIFKACIYCTLVPMYDFGARVFSNSWGDSQTAPGDVSGTYDYRGASADQFMIDNLDALVLFAAGNSGDPLQTPQSPSAMYSVNSPASFKNGIAVGAGLNDHQSWLSYTFGSADDSFSPNALAKFSSRGPTRDGRIKPEIVAPGSSLLTPLHSLLHSEAFLYGLGFWVTSAKGIPNSEYHTGVVGKAGTSMATPAVAATAAVVREYFMEGYYSSTGGNNSASAFTPSGALLKAMIISSGTEMQTIFSTYDGGTTYFLVPLVGYPSNDQGYGRVQMNNVMNFGIASNDPLSLFVVGDVNPAGSLYRQLNNVDDFNVFTFRVPTDQSVRITLSYTDYVSTSSSSSIMVNELFIAVTSDGISFTPSSQPSANTFQVIDFSAAADVLYYVNVTSSSNSFVFPQPYSLVMVASLGVKKLPATTMSQALEQSTLNLASVPFIPAIIGMTVVSFFILLTIITILVANRWPGKTGFFRVIRW